MDVYHHAVDILGDVYWNVGVDGVINGRPEACLVEYFYANTEVRSKIEIPRRFAKPESSCRCIIATIAFGLGIQIPDVKVIINSGPLKT